jgi:hypothetical protein
MVSQSLRSFALYHFRITPDEGEAKRLEATLLAIADPSGVGHGAGAVVTRGMARSETLRKLRAQRAAATQARSTIESKLDPLDVEDGASADG